MKISFRNFNPFSHVNATKTLKQKWEQSPTKTGKAKVLGISLVAGGVSLAGCGIGTPFIFRSIVHHAYGELAGTTKKSSKVARNSTTIFQPNDSKSIEKEPIYLELLEIIKRNKQTKNGNIVYFINKVKDQFQSSNDKDILIGELKKITDYLVSISSEKSGPCTLDLNASLPTKEELDEAVKALSNFESAIQNLLTRCSAEEKNETIRAFSQMTA